jgi:hypothetical protein
MITVSKSSAKAARRGRTGRDPLAHSDSSGTLSEIPRQTNAELISLHTEVIMDGVRPQRMKIGGALATTPVALWCR